MRWLRPLTPLVMIVVVWASFYAEPRPGLGGRGLAVAVALCSFVFGGVGALVTLWRSGAAHILFVVAVLAASVALVWLQPASAGVAGIFVSVALLAPVLRRYRSVPLTVVVLVLLGVVVGFSRHASLSSAVLDAIMIAAFYGTMFLAMRLREANELAEHLLVELEQTRDAHARAAGLAERQRLAREVHDVLAHSLSGLMLQLEGARMLVADNPADPRLAEAISRAHHLGKGGLEEARRAIGLLRDDELPGPERLAGLAAQFQHDRGIPCQFTVSGEPHALSAEARLAIYRVAQEALTNITKHAHAERIELHLAYEPTATRLTVEDFGATDSVPALVGAGRGDANDSEVNGYGLTGMRERAELLGGAFTTKTTPSGFRVELEVPA